LASFVRLVDYMCSEALIARVIDNADFLLAQLRAPRAVDAEKLPRPTFVALVDFEEVGMSFVPSEDAVRDILQSNVIEGTHYFLVLFAGSARCSLFGRVQTPICLLAVSHILHQTPN
jgi:hypothetical protein